MTYPGDAVSEWAAGQEAADVTAAANEAALAARDAAFDDRVAIAESNIARAYDTALTTVEEGPRRPEFYGPIAPGDDAAPAIRQAIADVKAASDNGYGWPAYVELGNREYHIGSEIAVTSGRTPIRGQGSQGGATILRHFGSYRGPLMSLSGARNGEAEVDSQTFRRNATAEGAEISDVMFMGDRSMSGHPVGLVTRGTLNSAYLRNLSFRYLSGGGLFLGDLTVGPGAGCVRESRLDWIELRGCGDGAAYPCMTIQNAGGGLGDGTNEISISDLEMIYCSGALRIVNDHPGETLRRVNFSGRTMAHGLAHAGSSASLTDLIEIIGGVTAVSFDDLFTNGAAAGFANLRTKASTVTGKSPQMLRIGWSEWSNNYGDLLVIERLANLKLVAEFAGTSPGGKNIKIPTGSGLVKGDVTQFGSNNNSIDPALLSGSPPKLIIR